MGWGVVEVTKAAAVSGTRDAERMRSNAQWYEPCDFEGGGKVVGSLTDPLYMAGVDVLVAVAVSAREYLRPPGT